MTNESGNAWNRCDVCGKFIALDDFDNAAIRSLIYPDSEFTCETWETLCEEHATKHLAPKVANNPSGPTVPKKAPKARVVHREIVNAPRER